MSLKPVIEFFGFETMDIDSPSGTPLAEEGEGEIVTYRDNLGVGFFTVLEELKSLGEPEDVRVVFWFDS